MIGEELANKLADHHIKHFFFLFRLLAISVTKSKTRDFKRSCANNILVRELEIPAVLSAIRERYDGAKI